MRRLVLTIAAFFALHSGAEDLSFEDVMSSVQGEITVRVTEGVIREIDLVTRTGIISGYKYWFGPPFSETPLKVFMYQSEGGALELMQVGMKVSITYADTGTARIATELRELADDAEVEN